MEGSEFKCRDPLPSYYRRKDFPEYQPDLGIEEE
jgi:hypothetical protein